MAKKIPCQVRGCYRGADLEVYGLYLCHRHEEWHGRDDEPFNLIDYFGLPYEVINGDPELREITVPENRRWLTEVEMKGQDNG